MKSMFPDQVCKKKINKSKNTQITVISNTMGALTTNPMDAKW